MGGRLPKRIYQCRSSWRRERRDNSGRISWPGITVFDDIDVNNDIGNNKTIGTFGQKNKSLSSDSINEKTKEGDKKNVEQKKCSSSHHNIKNILSLSTNFLSLSKLLYLIGQIFSTNSQHEWGKEQTNKPRVNRIDSIKK